MPTQQVGDVKLYYESTGRGQPLLLVHGLGSSTRDWEDQLPAFAGKYRVLTFDVRGHGQSDKPPGPYSVRQFAADAIGLLTALKTGPAHVVGLSMGGMIGLQMALDAPELVKTLVVVNSGPEVPQDTLAQKLAVWQRKILFQLFSMRRIGEVIGGRLFPELGEAGLKKTFIARWAENDKRAYLDATSALLDWSVTARLNEIKRPVLVVASEWDYTPVAMKEMYLKMIPNGRLAVIPAARHAVPASAPEKFNAVLAEWLAEHR